METYTCVYSQYDALFLSEGVSVAKHLPIGVTVRGAYSRLFMQVETVRRLRDRLTQILEAHDERQAD